MVQIIKQKNIKKGEQMNLDVIFKPYVAHTKTNMTLRLVTENLGYREIELMVKKFSWFF